MMNFSRCRIKDFRGIGKGSFEIVNKIFAAIQLIAIFAVADRNAETRSRVMREGRQT